MSQQMEATVEKESAVEMIDMVVDAKNREAWEARHQVEVKAIMGAFDGFVAMMKETFEAEARRRAGGLR